MPSFMGWSFCRKQAPLKSGGLCRKWALPPHTHSETWASGSGPALHHVRTHKLFSFFFFQKYLFSPPCIFLLPPPVFFSSFVIFISAPEKERGIRETKISTCVISEWAVFRVKKIKKQQAAAVVGQAPKFQEDIRSLQTWGIPAHTVHTTLFWKDTKPFLNSNITSQQGFDILQHYSFMKKLRGGNWKGLSLNDVKIKAPCSTLIEEKEQRNKFFK